MRNFGNNLFLIAAYCASIFFSINTLPDLTFLDGMVAIEYMRGPVALALLPAKCWFRQMYSMNGTPGLLVTSTPKKQEKNESDKTGLATKEMIDPIVAFSRPPSLPPVIGPLVALSLLETWWNRGTDEDGK